MNPIRRAAKIRLSQLSFWEHCKTIAPDFYFDERWHLKKICITLQALYEGRIQKEKTDEEWQIVPEKITGWLTCKKFMMNVPPQHGKTRTLVNFSSWVFGKNPKEKIITGSYNDNTASDFSRYTRDAITATGFDTDQILYSDIFPETKIKRGNAGFEKWALEGSHFSYLGVGVGGSVTSKGGSILIVDDPVKSAEEAFNENALEKIWLWYSSTFSSRVAAQDGEPIEIMNMTRWSNVDPCGRILESKDAPNWHLLKLQALNEATGDMLCPSLFSRKRFDSQRLLVYPQIFNANYQQESIEATGTLFKASELNYFYRNEVRLIEAEAVLAYGDIADEGDDALSMPVGWVFPQRIYLSDVLFTYLGSDTTPAMVAEKINTHKIKITRIEGNNQGFIFAGKVRELVGFEKINIIKNTSVQSKHSRIVLEYGNIKQFIYFLHPSEYKPESDYGQFMKQVLKYMKAKDANKKGVDAPDSLSGLAKFIIGVMLPHLFEPPKT